MQFRKIQKFILLAIVFQQLSFLPGDTYRGLTDEHNDNKSTALYKVTSSNEITMKINIWGEVQKPGQYLIPYSLNPDVITMISIAGGPSPQANLKKITIYRESGKEQIDPITVNISGYFKNSSPLSVVKLEPNETIIIQKNIWGKINSGQSILTIANLVTTMILILNN